MIVLLQRLQRIFGIALRKNTHQSATCLGVKQGFKTHVIRQIASQNFDRAPVLRMQAGRHASG
jgi:hypothetical protein